jgi:hypothetical protein
MAGVASLLSIPVDLFSDLGIQRGKGNDTFFINDANPLHPFLFAHGFHGGFDIFSLIGHHGEGGASQQRIAETVDIQDDVPDGLFFQVRNEEKGKDEYGPEENQSQGEAELKAQAMEQSPDHVIPSRCQKGCSLFLSG